MRHSLGWLVLLSSACAWSPPIRGLHAGMPDRVARGQLELSGTAGGFGMGNVSAPTTGGPQVAYGLSDTLVLEAGANLNLVDRLWATTWAGVRLLRKKPLAPELTLVGDLELGAGVGLGGNVSGPSPPPPGAAKPLPWTSRYAGGFYEGLGVGLRWRWAGAFLRGRLDASANTNAPSTLWPSLALGLEAKAGPHVVFALAGGLAAFWSEGHGAVALWFYQAQVALLFDLLPGTLHR